MKTKSKPADEAVRSIGQEHLNEAGAYLEKIEEYLETMGLEAHTAAVELEKDANFSKNTLNRAREYEKLSVNVIKEISKLCKNKMSEKKVEDMINDRGDEKNV